MLQICQLCKRDETMRIIGHGPTDRRRIECFPIVQGIRLSREPLRGRTGEALRIQETVRPYFENRGFRLPRCWQHRRVPGALLEFPVPLPFLRLRRHRWHGMPSQPSLQSHSFGHSGERFHNARYPFDFVIIPLFPSEIVIKFFFFLQKVKYYWKYILRILFSLREIMTDNDLWSLRSRWRMRRREKLMQIIS